MRFLQLSWRGSLQTKWTISGLNNNVMSITLDATFHMTKNWVLQEAQVQLFFKCATISMRSEIIGR